LHVFDTTFQFCKSGFLSFKLPYIDLELTAHPEKTKQQAQKNHDEQINKPHGTHAHREVQRLTTTWTKNSKTIRVPEEFKSSSSTRQLQKPSSKDMQQTNML
jgi:hypothetical protein